MSCIARLVCVVAVLLRTARWRMRRWMPSVSASTVRRRWPAAGAGGGRGLVARHRLPGHPSRAGGAGDDRDPRRPRWPAADRRDCRQQLGAGLHRPGRRRRADRDDDATPDRRRTRRGLAAGRSVPRTTRSSCWRSMAWPSWSIATIRSRASTCRNCAGIFSGQVRDWRDVGGARGPIRLQMVPRRELRPRPGRRAGDARQRATALSRQHADGPACCGRRRRSAGDRIHHPAPAAGARAFDRLRSPKAAAPWRRRGSNVLSEDYPLTRRLYLYGSQMMGALSRSFALYAMGQRGQDAVAAQATWA